MLLYRQDDVCLPLFLSINFHGEKIMSDKSGARGLQNLALEEFLAAQERERQRAQKLKEPFEIWIGSCFDFQCQGQIIYKRYFVNNGQHYYDGQVTTVEKWECYCTICGAMHHRDAELIAPIIKDYLDSL